MTQNKSTTSDIRALVVGSGYNAYGLVRSLGRARIGCHLLCSGKSRSALASSQLLRSKAIPQESEKQRSQILRFLNEIGKKTVILPTDEVCAVELIDHAEQYMQHGGLLPYLNPRASKLCIAKDQFANWCRDKGVLTPHLDSFAPSDCWGQFCKRLLSGPFPLVIKPITKGLEKEDLGFFCCRVFESRDAAEHWTNQFATSGPMSGLVVERFVPGPVSNLVSLQGYIDRHGGLRASQYRKLSQTAGPVGCANVALIEPCNAELVDLARQILVDKLRFHGFFDIEFKLHQTTGEFYLIEINPRPGMLNYAATVMGSNLPKIAIHDVMQIESPAALNECKTTRKPWVWTRHIPHFCSSWKEARRSSSFWPRQIVMACNRWRKPYLGRPLMDPLWSWRDPGPYFRQLSELAQEAVRRGWRRARSAGIG